MRFNHGRVQSKGFAKRSHAGWFEFINNVILSDLSGRIFKNCVDMSNYTLITNFSELLYIDAYVIKRLYTIKLEVSLNFLEVKHDWELRVFMTSNLYRLLLVMYPKEQVEEIFSLRLRYIHPHSFILAWFHGVIVFISPITPVSLSIKEIIRYVITLSNCYTKWVEAVPLPCKCATGVANFLLKEKRK